MPSQNGNGGRGGPWGSGGAKLDSGSGLTFSDDRRRGLTLADVLRAAGDAQESQRCGHCERELLHRKPALS